jgi:hypothetical protein
MAGNCPWRVFKGQYIALHPGKFKTAYGWPEHGPSSASYTMKFGAYANRKVVRWTKRIIERSIARSCASNFGTLGFPISWTEYPAGPVAPSLRQAIPRPIRSGYGPPKRL